MRSHVQFMYSALLQGVRTLQQLFTHCHSPICMDFSAKTVDINGCSGTPLKSMLLVAVLHWVVNRYVKVNTAQLYCVCQHELNLSNMCVFCCASILKSTDCAEW